MQDHNDPELDGKQLGIITANFVKVADTLKEAAYQLKVRDISEHPIFVFCPEEPEVGAGLMPKGQFGLDYFVNFSYLDEFRQRGLVTDDHLQDFLKAYKDPEEFACVFVVLPGFINFIYIPYPEE